MFKILVVEDDKNLQQLMRTFLERAGYGTVAFPALDDEGVRNALKETLFCRLEGDSLEGELCPDKPFVPGYRTYSAVADSRDLTPAEKSAAMTNINTYINVLIAGRSKKGSAASE